MTTDLTMLVLSAILCVLLVLPGSRGLTEQQGMDAAIGNRESLPPLTGWAGRAKRAHANMVENLIPFAALVLAAHIAGKSGSLTAWGAQLFFWARLAHAGVYIAGITVVRTLAWLVSVVGMALIAIAYFA